MSTKVALITGAGHRLGAATANRLMNAGWFVLIHVRSSRQAAQELLEQAEAQNNRKCGAILQADLTVDDQLKHLVDEVKNHALVKENGLSGLVHNASFYSQSTFEETSFETFRNLNRLHMEAPYYLTQQLLPELRSSRGSVVGIVDTSWGKAWEGLSHYTSSKAGLRQLMLNLAGELSPDVNVNCLRQVRLWLRIGKPNISPKFSRKSRWVVRAKPQILPRQFFTCSKHPIFQARCSMLTVAGLLKTPEFH